MSTPVITRGQDCLPPGEPTAPANALPAGACDCHAHVLGPFARYPLAASRPYDPPEAPLAQLEQMMSTMGVERVVIAHVSAHGMDLSVTLDAMAALGDRARGIAMLTTDADTALLRKLDAAGMRGVRLSMAYGGDTPLDENNLRIWADKLAEFGWHIAMWPMDLAQLKLLERLSGKLAVPLVLDHLASHGWFNDGQERPEGLAVLRGLLDSGHAWLKLSGMYRAGAGSSPWQQLVPAMSEIAKQYTHRMLWASDWPFVGLYDMHQRPASGQLLDWLWKLGLDDAQRKQILVDNPQTVYRFPST
jgi:2-pyrone-4,6-dicarboxylate lactonase